MPNKNNTRRKARPKLNKEHYATYWLLFHAFDYDERPANAFVKIAVTDNRDARYVFRRVRALAKLAGITHELGTSPASNISGALISKVFDDAMKAVYIRAKARASYDTTPAFQIAERIKHTLEMYARSHDDGQEHDEEGERVIKGAVERFGPDAVEELLKLVSEGGHGKREILRRVRRLIKKKDETSERVEELRERLRELRDEGEAHNESAIFKLEREIYDLEHKSATPDEEWPEYITG